MLVVKKVRIFSWVVEKKKINANRFHSHKTPWAEPISRTQLHSSDSMVIYGFEPFDYELYPSK